MCLPDGTPSRRPLNERKPIGSQMKEDRFARGVRESKQSQACQHGEVVLWGIRMTCLSPQHQLIILGAAMFLCHVLQGILTEHVAKGMLSGLMWAAAAIELTVYSILSAIELRMTGAAFNIHSMPWRSYASIATCISVGRGLTWVGYGTLSYPTVLLFKSSKILVVMLTGIIILGKRFAPAEYGAALLSVAGLYLFSVADTASVGESADSLKGIGLMLLAVASEATVSTLQERSLHEKRRPLAEMIFVTNSLGAVILLAIAASGGELAKLQQRLETHPTAILWLLATVVLAYGGSYAFTACIKGFGAVVATGVGICRKFVSVMASYTIFPKPVNVQHVFGILLFFAGMVLSWSQQASLKRPHGKLKQGKQGKQAKRTSSGEAQPSARPADEAELTCGRVSDSSSMGADGDVDSDENFDSPSRGVLVATPHGTPGTPTTAMRPSRGRWGQTVNAASEGEKRRQGEGEKMAHVAAAGAWSEGQKTRSDSFGEAGMRSVGEDSLGSPNAGRTAPLGPR